MRALRHGDSFAEIVEGGRDTAVLLDEGRHAEHQSYRNEEGHDLNGEPASVEACDFAVEADCLQVALSRCATGSGQMQAIDGEGAGSQHCQSA